MTELKQSENCGFYLKVFGFRKLESLAKKLSGMICQVGNQLRFFGYLVSLTVL